MISSLCGVQDYYTLTKSALLPLRALLPSLFRGVHVHSLTSTWISRKSFQGCTADRHTDLGVGPGNETRSTCIIEFAD